MLNMFKKQKDFDAFCISNQGLTEYPYNKQKLALNVELGEFANEFSEWKYWKKNKATDKDKAKKELADCLHLAFSLLGEESKKDNEIDLNKVSRLLQSTEGFIRHVSHKVYDLEELFLLSFISVCENHYNKVIGSLFLIGYKLGFGHDEIIKEYYRVLGDNIKRQGEGY